MSRINSLGFVLLFMVAALSGFAQELTVFKPADAAALQSLATKWEHYWNSHNMDSMGTLLREDVDFVNVGGVWLKGKQNTVADHKQKHQSIVFKNSVWTTDEVAIKYVKPDLAILHVRWGIKGDNDLNGTPRTPRRGIFTWVANKEKGQWAILAAHNVNVREPAPSGN
jgi:uncharacterized protein (TIGR02246 family)